ncbi:hypothetical protein ACTXT7_003031 [Hymenolepis weldensis]
MDYFFLDIFYNAETRSFTSLSTISEIFAIFRDEHNPSSEVKALPTKFEGSKHVDSSITSGSSVPSSYSIKPVFVEIEDVTKNVPEFIHDPKSGKFFEYWYN